MSNVANKYKVGIFVAAGIVLLLTAFVILGTLKYFQPTMPFVTVVTQTVQGLEAGAKVKFKGVTVGQVTAVSIQDETGNILIRMALNLSASERRYRLWGYALEKRILTEAKKMVGDGLRCQLRMEGITGTLYQELILLPPQQYPLKDLPPAPPGNELYIPSIPRVEFTTIMDKLQQSLDNISKIPFEKIAKDTETLLTSTSNLINSKELRETLDISRDISKNLRDLTGSMNKTFTAKRINEIASRADVTLAKIDGAIDNINKLAVGSRETLTEARIPQTTASVRDFMSDSSRSVGEVKQNLLTSLNRMNDAILSLTALIEYIERNPNSIIVGKSQLPLVPHR